MKDSGSWGMPDWEWPRGVTFTDQPFSKGTVFMAILLGGILAGLIAAGWHLLNSAG
jgi:hypothetical protein